MDDVKGPREPPSTRAPDTPEAEALAELVEREWVDRFGHHYEVTARRSSGPVFRQKVTKYGAVGWPKEREGARADVLRALSLAGEEKEPGP